MAIDKATRDSIIVAAITGAGPVGENAEEWEVNVLRGARKITAVLADPDSIFSKAIEEIDGAGKFVSLVCLVKKETKSTRGLVYFQNIPKIANGETPALRYTYEEVAAIHVSHVAAVAAARAAGQKPPALPDGLESVRTERTDSLDGLAMAKEATSLIGHRVLVYKINDPIPNTTPPANVRVVRHLTDLGTYAGYVVPAKAPAVAAA